MFLFTAVLCLCNPASVPDMLRRPVKTFTTACTYYHLFRLCHRDAEYNYQDASLAALFMACKVEDTIKKSKEILCAAYNIKNPDHPTTQDDKVPISYEDSLAHFFVSRLADMKLPGL